MLLRLGNHPNFFTFIARLKVEIETTISKVRQAEQGLLSLAKSKRSRQVESTRKKLKEMLDNNVIPLRRFMRGIGATGAKVQVKGKLVHQNEPIEEEGDGLSRAVLVSVSDSVNAPEVQQRGRGQGQRQCNGCNNFYSQRYYYAHVSRFCSGIPGQRGRRSERSEK